MKCISLIQPWASLIVFGEKGFETRRWATKYRGPLLIASSKRMPADCKALCQVEPFRSALGAEADELPLGVILGKVTLVECYPVEDMPAVGDEERAFGDYRQGLGRYAWQLVDAVAFGELVPVRGALGVYEVSDVCLPAEAKRP